MISQIIEALVNAINEHPDAAISGLFGILGTLVGWLSGLLYSWWKERGKIVLTPIAMHWKFEGIGDRSQGDTGMAPRTAANANQVSYNFSFRLLNTYTIPKSLAVERVEFHPQQASWFKRSTPILYDPFKMISTVFNDMKPDDIQIPPSAFIRIYMSGVGMTEEQGKRAQYLAEWTRLKIVLLVSPNKRVTFWHTFDRDTVPTKRRWIVREG